MPMAGCFEMAAGGIAGRNGAKSCAVSGGGTGAVAIVRVCGGSRSSWVVQAGSRRVLWWQRCLVRFVTITRWRSGSFEHSGQASRVTLCRRFGRTAATWWLATQEATSPTRAKRTSKDLMESFRAGQDKWKGKEDGIWTRGKEEECGRVRLLIKRERIGVAASCTSGLPSSDVPSRCSSSRLWSRISSVCCWRLNDSECRRASQWECQRWQPPS